MAALDDLPLGSGPDDATEVAPSAPSSPGPRVVLFGVLIALAIGASVWYYRTWPRATPASTTAAAPASPSEALVSPPVVPVLPPLPEMDPYVRTLLTALSANPELLKWLATDDLVGAIVTAVDRIAQGQSPARDLAVLRPTQGFSVARGDGVARADAAAYARYAPLVAAVATVDPAQLAAAFKTLMPRLSESYIAHGHPEGGFDRVAAKAIEIIASTPDLPADAALVPGVGGYAYADPALERLPAAQKQLLRMGPDHVRRVREAARQFGAALAAPATTTAP